MGPLGGDEKELNQYLKLIAEAENVITEELEKSLTCFTFKKMPQEQFFGIKMAG